MLLAENPGFGGSSRQHSDSNPTYFDPDCKFVHVKVNRRHLRPPDASLDFMSPLLLKVGSIGQAACISMMHCVSH